MKCSPAKRQARRMQTCLPWTTVSFQSTPASPTFTYKTCILHASSHKSTCLPQRQSTVKSNLQNTIQNKQVVQQRSVIYAVEACKIQYDAILLSYHKHKHQFTLLQSSKMILNEKSLDGSEQSLRSKVRVVGYFPNKYEENQKNNSHFSELIHDSIVTIINKRKAPYEFKPILVVAELSCMAIIDNEHRAWLITDFISEPICISELLRKKVYSLSLSFSQLIAQTRTGHILINWGHPKSLGDQTLQKITEQTSKHKYSHFFQIFNILNSKRQDSYYFSTVKKVSDENSLYGIVGGGTVIRGYPKIRQIRFQKRVLGISVGKNYKLCWDETGKLYSWGYKSIGLGYAVIPDEEYIMQPRQVQLIKGHVIKAYADMNYSLAITLDGKLYEWGVQQSVDLGSLSIVKMNKQKCIDIKGNYQKFGVLTLSGQLFIWGKSTKQFFSKNNNHIQWQSDSSITSPKLLPQEEGFVIDFQISQSFIALVINTKNCSSISISQKRYWQNLKENIKDNLIYRRSIIKTQGSEQPNIRRRQRLSDQKIHTLSSFRKMKNSIEIALSKKKSKQEYFEATALDSQKMIRSIMEPTERSRQGLMTSENDLSDRDPIHLPVSRSKMKIRINTRFSRLAQQFENEKEYVKLLVNGVPNAEQRHNKIARLPRNTSQKLKNYIMNKTSKPYTNRLMQVLKKKEEYQQQSLLQTIKKVESRSFEYRMKKIQQNQENRKKLKQIEIYKHTIQSILIKQFIVKLFSKPVVEGREAKIANFARSLKLARLEKNIRGLFTRTRIKFEMRKLQRQQMFRFFLLVMIFRRYVKRFRLRKCQRLRKFVVNQCFKSVVKQKIKVGIAACIFNIRKLQKFREWLAMVQNERKRCLKYIWKIHLLSMMKINSDNQSSAIFYLPKNIDELSFESLYRQRLTANPLLLLKNFLNKYSIFRIKANYFQKLVGLFSLEQKKSQLSNIRITRTAKFSILGKTRKGRIKFYEDQQDKQDRFNLMQADILPYSLHYNILIHPKNYDVAISQIAKLNQKWIKFERNLLQKCITLIITSHEKEFILKKRDYDVEMAHFIRKNYEQISQKRWKFIIEFNQIQKTSDHDKRQRELRRLMKLISAENILDQDCIPQKQYVLEEARRRCDAPVPPNSFIIFGAPEFKKLFRLYYQQLFGKAKQLKRNFL